jgi:hypothetical protein
VRGKIFQVKLDKSAPESEFLSAKNRLAAALTVLGASVYNDGAEHARITI